MIVTPRVTFDGDVILELSVESSTVGQDVNIAGQNFPSFGSRKVDTKIRLRDGESTLLAGLLREDTRRTFKGFPGLIHLPVVKSFFTSNDVSTGQTDIVMLLTPRIVRGHDLAQQDVDPVYIGSQQSIGLSGPPPLIAAPPEPSAPPSAPAPGAAAQPSQPTAPAATGTLPAPGVQPQTPAPAPVPPTPPAETPQPQSSAQAPPLLQPEPAPVPADQAAPGAAAGMRLAVTTPGPELRMGGGPYTVPISVSEAPRVSTVTVTLTYDPAVLRVRAVQEGSFMRQGGVAAQFTQSIDEVNGRVDLTVIRGGDTVGASGGGLIAAVIVEPVTAGKTTITAVGSAAGPSGAPVSVQAAPVGVTVK